MKENSMKEVLEAIAQRDVPVDVNLMPAITSRIERKSLMKSLRARPVLTVLLALLALALLSGVAYAIGRARGYIPGVGLVDQAVSLRILAEPASLEREGITITVKQVVADSDHTVVQYILDGIPIRANEPLVCSTVPLLQLPNGSSLELIDGASGGFGGEIGTRVSLEITGTSAPIPANVNQVTFFLHCILPEGKGPEDWRIPLDLVRAPDNYATPAIELDATYEASGPKFNTAPTPTLETTLIPEQNDASFPNTPTPVPNGSGLYLEQVIELPNSYILVGNFADTGDLPGYVLSTGSAHDYLPRIENAQGNPVEFKVRDDIKPAVNWANTYYWAYEIKKPVKGPLTIILDEIHIAATDRTQFNFDTGSNPQVGQKWELNLPVHLRNYDYVIDSVEAIKNGYRFNYHSGTDAPEGVSLEINIVGSSPDGGNGQLINGKTVVRYSDSITYLAPIPTGKLTVELSLMETIPLQGPWTLTWSPPSK